MTAAACVVVKSRVGRPPREYRRIARSTPEVHTPGTTVFAAVDFMLRGGPVTDHELWS